MKTCMETKNVITPEDCTAPATHEVRRYFFDGRSLYYCEKHARQWDQLHPLGTRATPLKKGKAR